MIQYLIEMKAYDPSLPGERTLYFSTHGYTSPPDGTPPNQHYARRISQPGNFETTMFQSGKTSGASRIGFGEVVLQNPDGGLDQLIDYGFDGREIVFKIVDSGGVVSRVTGCTMEQPEFNDDEITIRIKDAQAIFNAALQSVKYAGSNVLPNGVEGRDDIKGKPKPVCLGKVYNLTPVLVNTSKLIYQLHDAAADVPAVYDKGAALLREDDYQDLAEMEATAPTPGYYRAWTGGGCFRLGASAAGQVTCDAVEGATAADRTAAQVARRIALRASAAVAIEDADLAQLDAENSAEVGYYSADETTVLAALDAVLGSVGAWFGFDLDLKLRMQRFTAPTGDPDFTLTPARWKSLSRVASSDTGRGISPWRVNLNYQKNYTVQTSDLAGSLQAGDGSTRWELRIGNLPTGTWSAAFGNGLFVAVLADSDTCATSLDGITWTMSNTLPRSTRWRRIVYGDGLFVAVAEAFGANNTLSAAVSVDGVNWVQGTMPSGGSWTALASGNGVYVSLLLQVTSDNRVGAVSGDGVSWSQVSLPSGSASFIDICFGGGVFVAITADSAAISEDGSAWSAVTLPALVAVAGLGTPVWSAITYGNGVFVAVAGNSGQAAISPDGVQWTAAQLPTARNWNRIVYGSGYFMATADDTGSAISSDGYRWTQITAPVAFGSPFLSYGGGHFLAGRGDTGAILRYLVTIPSSRSLWLAKEYRTVSEADEAVRTRHLLAPELNIDTLLVDPTAAFAEAVRVLDLYSLRRDTLSVAVDASVLRWIGLGKKVKIVYPRYGYSAGKLFRVIGVTPEWSAGNVALTLWG